MKKEIEVWVHPNLLKDSREGKVFAVLEKEYDHSIKARLIIDLPEKKIEISEADLDDLNRQFHYCADENPYFYKFLKQKLFGAQE